jgi:hypothetical protein
MPVAYKMMPTMFKGPTLIIQRGEAAKVLLAGAGPVCGLVHRTGADYSEEIFATVYVFFKAWNSPCLWVFGTMPVLLIRHEWNNPCLAVTVDSSYIFQNFCSIIGHARNNAA